MKKKRTKKTTLRNKADRLFSRYIRSKGYCELNGKDKVRCGGVLQTMHILTRGYTALRYAKDNVICGCAGHHVYYTYHEHEWEQIIRTYFPKKWKYIENHRNDTVKKTEDLYQEVIEKYKKYL